MSPLEPPVGDDAEIVFVPEALEPTVIELTVVPVIVPPVMVTALEFCDAIVPNALHVGVFPEPADAIT